MSEKQLEHKGWTQQQIKHVFAWQAARKRGNDSRTAVRIADIEVGKVRRPRG